MLVKVNKHTIIDSYDLQLGPEEIKNFVSILAMARAYYDKIGTTARPDWYVEQGVITMLNKLQGELNNDSK